MAFIPNVEGGSTDQSLNKVVLAALSTLEPAQATKYVAQLLEDEGCHERQDCEILVWLHVIIYACFRSGVGNPRAACDP